MISFNKMGFLAITLIFSGQSMASELNQQLLPRTSSDTDSGNSDGTPFSTPDKNDFIVNISETNMSHLDLSPQKKGWCDSSFSCLKGAANSIFGFCGLTSKVEAILKNNPTFQKASYVGSQVAISIAMSNQFRGEVFPLIAQHNAGEAIQEGIKDLKLPLLLELGIYAGLSTAFFQMDLATYPVEPTPGIPVPPWFTTGTTVSPDYVYNQHNGFESGMPKVMVLAAFARFKREWTELDKKKIK